MQFPYIEGLNCVWLLTSIAGLGWFVGNQLFNHSLLLLLTDGTVNNNSNLLSSHLILRVQLNKGISSGVLVKGD